MNLVAKEYVAAQDPDNPGCSCSHASRGPRMSSDGALLVNPHDPAEIAEALDRALTMGLPERKERWRDMMDQVERNTAATWAQSFLDQLAERRAEAA